MPYFLSHAGKDKPIARRLGVELQVIGTELFFDEWSIEAGESITGAIELAIEQYDVFLLIRSQEASKSAWTVREYRAAVRFFIEAPGRKLIVLRADDTPAPPLVNDLKWIDLRDEDVSGAVQQIMGFRGPADRIKAIQRFLDERGIEVI